MSPRWKPWLNRLKLLAALGLATFAIVRLSHRDPPPTAAPGASLTLTALHTLDGQAVDPQALAGHVVVLNFWATWCPACRGELPDLVRFSQLHRHDCVNLLGISGEDAGTVSRFAQSHGLDYPLAVSGGALEDQLGVEVIPTSVVLGPDGKIAARVEGAVTPEQLQALVAPLLSHASC